MTEPRVIPDHRWTPSTALPRLSILVMLIVILGFSPASGAEPRKVTPGPGSRVVFDLGPQPDASVLEDAASLAGLAAELFPSEATIGFDDGRATFLPGGSLKIANQSAPPVARGFSIRHLGRGRLMSGEANGEGQGDGTGSGDSREFDEPAGSSSMVAFNPKTGNEFIITTTTAQLAAIAAEAERTGLNRETDVPPSRSGATFGAPTADAVTIGSADFYTGFAPLGFSGGNDDRFRPYAVNAAVTNNVDRRRVQVGTGCSGTLVGPRHVVTAGHCLYNRLTQAWGNNFTVRSGRNGNSVGASVLVNTASIPPGQVIWYFTPAEWRNLSVTNTDPFDFAIIVLPGRLGDAAGGWFGWWALGDATLQATTINRAGYPACAATFGTPPVPRIDVLQTDAPLACYPNHYYRNANPCQVGNFRNAKDGWSRTLDHSCDASAADSGSGLTTNFNGLGNGVVGIHFFSLCGKTATDVACTGNLNTLPLRAIRITPEYSGWISHFRKTYP
ncbi:MAG TPA: trypsin-like serine protease [Thermoanaerobaculia bacterium]